MSKHHHVVRIDIEPSEESPRRSSTHGWQVRVSHDGTRKTKFFADRKYGGRGEALALAIEHRDKLLAERPEPTGPVERRPQKRSTSGVAGVRLAFKNDTPYIEANWVGEDGRSVTSYSVNRWGLRRATWRACKSRAVGLGVRDPERVQKMFETAYPNLQESIAKALDERDLTLDVPIDEQVEGPQEASAMPSPSTNGQAAANDLASTNGRTAHVRTVKPAESAGTGEREAA